MVKGHAQSSPNVVSIAAPVEAEATEGLDFAPFRTGE